MGGGVTLICGHLGRKYPHHMVHCLPTVSDSCMLSPPHSNEASDEETKRTSSVRGAWRLTGAVVHVLFSCVPMAAGTSVYHTVWICSLLHSFTSFKNRAASPAGGGDRGSWVVKTGVVGSRPDASVLGFTSPHGT